MSNGAALPNARLWRRLAAVTYDLILVLALLMALTAGVMLARRGVAFDPRSLWYRLLLLAGWWLYFAWCWTHGGRTVGMRAWRLVLTGPRGTTVGWGRASLRFLCAWLSALPAGLGFFWSLVDRDRLAWHDRASGTTLKYERASAQPQNRESGHDQ